MNACAEAQRRWEEEQATNLRRQIMRRRLQLGEQEERDRLEVVIVSDGGRGVKVRLGFAL